jgi:hypothetical protein
MALLIRTPQKAIAVVASRTLSDEDKQKRILAIAGTVFITALKFVMMLVIMFGIGLLPVLVVAELLSLQQPVFTTLCTWEALLASLVFAAGYVGIRKRLVNSESETSSKRNLDYGPISKLLHRVALGMPHVAEASFDINRMVAKTDTSTQDGPHVFIAGLARAGTTILMRSIYTTGVYRSLTYRDMPFVLMPNIWPKISRLSRQHKNEAERCHGDRINVDFDSPEAFEEVFWRTMCHGAYIKKHVLRSHQVSPEVLDKFREYIADVVASAEDSRQTRYLSKNNNNLLRLGCIRKAFPDAVILIPYRDPIQHAISLQRQHEHFTARHDEDRFSLDYMNWLGHHEFGRNHKPFYFPEDEDDFGGYSPEHIEYWLEVWRRTYRHVLGNAPEGCLFLSYEALCTASGNVIPLLFEKLGTTPPPGIHGTLERAPHKEVPDLNQEVVSGVREVHRALETRGFVESRRHEVASATRP